MSEETMEKIILRTARPDDARALLEIYAPYVENTAISFECEVPDLEEFARRISSTLEKYPYIVAELDGRAVGYAYAGTFKARAAYDWSVETSVYVRSGMHSLGIGRRLYQALEAALKAQNILNLNACIAFTQEADEFLNDASVRFHARLGYRTVGTFTKCANKFGRWYDMVWMEKHIGDHLPDPAHILTFKELGRSIEDILKGGAEQ